jgi:hemerythrin superfamily protein
MATSAKDGKSATRAKTKTPARRKAAAGAAPVKPGIAAKPKAPRKSSATPAIEPKSAAPLRAVAQAAPAVVEEAKTVAAKALAAVEVPEVVKTAAAKVLPAKAAAPAKKTPAAAARRKAPVRRGAAASKGVSAGTVLGVAAAGLAAGIVANLGRKAAVQAPSVMAGDWMEALKGEHRAALALLDQLGKTTEKQVAKRTLLLAQLRHALGRHAFTEENVIYTALREWGDKADADALNHEQGYHKQYLYELDGLPKGEAAFGRRVADFRKDLESHIREEEDKIFPKLHKALTAEKNKALTALANKEGFRLA